MTFPLGETYRSIRAVLEECSPGQRRDIAYTALSCFLILFSYPFIRVTTTTLFLDTHGAQDSPIVWTFSVLALSLFVALYAKAQETYPMGHLYLGTALFSLLVFVGGRFLLNLETYYTTYVLFIWKEAYIMLMLGMITGLLNVSMKTPTAKIIYGPLGAVGSLGGILGGILTSRLAQDMAVENILIVGSLMIFCSYLSFLRVEEKTHVEGVRGLKSEQPPQGLGSCQEICFSLGPPDYRDTVLYQSGQLQVQCPL